VGSVTGTPRNMATSPPTMLQKAVSARAGWIGCGECAIDAEHDIDVVLVDLDPLDQGADQVAGPVASLTGDGAYDQDRVYASVAQRHPEAAVVVPPHATTVSSEMAESAPTQRDGHLQHIAEHGRMAWQNASGYNRRARVEATMNRWKQVIGDELRAHTDECRATEVAVTVHALNRMLELGRPSYVRVT